MLMAKVLLAASVLVFFIGGAASIVISELNKREALTTSTCLIYAESRDINPTDALAICYR